MPTSEPAHHGLHRPAGAGSNRITVYALSFFSDPKIPGDQLVRRLDVHTDVGHCRVTQTGIDVLAGPWRSHGVLEVTCAHVEQRIPDVHVACRSSPRAAERPAPAQRLSVGTCLVDQHVVNGVAGKARCGGHQGVHNLARHHGGGCDPGPRRRQRRTGASPSACYRRELDLVLEDKRPLDDPEGEQHQQRKDQGSLDGDRATLPCVASSPHQDPHPQITKHGGKNAHRTRYLFPNGTTIGICPAMGDNAGDMASMGAGVSGCRGDPRRWHQ